MRRPHDAQKTYSPPDQRKPRRSVVAEEIALPNRRYGAATVTRFMRVERPRDDSRAFANVRSGTHAMRKLRPVVVIAAVIASVLFVVEGASSPLGAATNRWPHLVTDGFSTPSGAGFWLVYADGTVRAYGDARSYGDASNIRLNGPIVGGAATRRRQGILAGRDRRRHLHVR